MNHFANSPPHLINSTLKGVIFLNLEIFEMPKYIKLLSGRYRFSFIELINTTRNYHYGLYIADVFEKVVKEHENEFTPREIELAYILIFHLRLNSLDKLDSWMAFVDYYERLSSIKPMTQSLEILLQLQEHRYKVIKRKIDKFRKSAKLGNLYHRSQSELTDEEIEERAKELVERVINFEKKNRFN